MHAAYFVNDFKGIIWVKKKKKIVYYYNINYKLSLNVTSKIKYDYKY